mmetsp:Transcript_73540/g.116021  ORF Transcript_73540/g.116021 Transcript_73540/m.116021 type:complete len:216 (+) Transcript_73540:54-701(+)
MAVSAAALQGLGKTSLDMATRGRPQENSFNWGIYNYPPFLRLIHFDIEELNKENPSLVGLVRCFKKSFEIATVACILNLLSTIIIATTTEAPFKWAIQSLIHLVIIPTVALAVFYAGYRGLADKDSTLIFRFKVGQPLLALLYALLAILPLGCINGLAQLGSIDEHTNGEGSTVWTVFIIIESVLWFFNACIAIFNVVRGHQYSEYGTTKPLSRV